MLQYRSILSLLIKTSLCPKDRDEGILREEMHTDVPIIVLTAVIDDDLRIRAQE
jgi:hypothetical protein